MKRIISLALSLIMLISCISIGTINSFAAKKTAVPAVKLNQSVSLSVDPVSDDDIMADYDNLYYVKFTAPSTGSYLFSFDKAYNAKGSVNETGETEPAVATAILEDSKDEMINFSIAMSLNGLKPDEIKMYKEFGLLDNLSFTADLKANTTYYLAIKNRATSAYSTNLIIKTHKHTLKTETRKVEVDEDGETYGDGGIYYVCTNQFCDYEELDEEFPDIKFIALSKTKFTYDKKAKKPAVVITLSNGKKMPAKYYSVKYLNNTKVGKATAEITFKGHYSGKVKKTFKIVPKKTEITKLTAKKKALTVKYSKRTAQTTGYEIQTATNKKFSKNKKTTVVSKKKTTTKTVKGLKSKKTYFVRVRTYKSISGKKYYSSWSKVKQIKTK